MKTTAKDFKLFKDEVERLLKVYGLMGWEYSIIHKKIDDITVSQTQADFPTRTVVFTLNTNKLQGTETLLDSALHEVLELLLWRLEEMSCKSVSTREEVHSIIQTLINVRRL